MKDIVLDVFTVCRKFYMNANDQKVNADWEIGKKRKNLRIRVAGQMDWWILKDKWFFSAQSGRNNTEMVMSMQLWRENRSEVETASDETKGIWRQATKGV